MELSDHEITKRIGRNIHMMRRIAGLSQQAIGDALGVTFQQVQKYENGFNRISPAFLVRLAALFHCQITDFFAGLDVPAPIEPEAEAQMPEYRMAKAYGAIESPKVKKAILAMTEALGRSGA